MAKVAAQKIACINNSAFEMWFKVATAGGSSDASDNYHINKTRTIDLAETPFQEGFAFWVEIHPIGGKIQSSEDQIIYKKNGKIATFAISGTTEAYNISLLIDD